MTTLSVNGQTSTPEATKPGGTFGQSVLAYGSSDMLTAGTLRSIVGIREDSPQSVSGEHCTPTRAPPRIRGAGLFTFYMTSYVIADVARFWFNQGMKALTIADAPEIVLGLQDEIRRSLDSRYDHRLHGILLVAQGMTCPEVGALLGDAPRTVEYWVERFERSGLAGRRETVQSVAARQQHLASPMRNHLRRRV